jgi:hypothetical protein
VTVHNLFLGRFYMYTEKTFSPSDWHKVAVFEHVLYEIDMFVALQRESTDTIASNCGTEAFLVHARILCDFFQKDRRKDDIVCADYGYHQQSLGISQDIEMRFDKCLAHLTYSRSCFTEDTKVWLLQYFRPALLDRIRGFLTHVTTQCTLPLRADHILRAENILLHIGSKQ